MDACLDVVLPGILSTADLANRVISGGGYDFEQMPPGKLQRLPTDFFIGRHRYYVVRYDALDDAWKALSPPFGDDDLRQEETLREPTALERFLATELANDRTWALKFLPQCDQLDEVVETDREGALALLRASLAGKKWGFLAIHNPRAR
jgi:hypothetical protein